ncbi:LOW QUALITY PROTEIN: NKG2-D type II integral membrane protein-like [Megaptera novaeangliae]
MSESHNHASELVKHGASTRQQKRTCTSVTSKCGENSSPFFLASIAVAMRIRFIVMVVICSAMIINSLFNQEAPISLKAQLCVPGPSDNILVFIEFMNIALILLMNARLAMVEMQNGNCAVYGSSFKAYTENCLTPNTYICMQRIV